MPLYFSLGRFDKNVTSEEINDFTVKVTPDILDNNQIEMFTDLRDLQAVYYRLLESIDTEYGPEFGDIKAGVSENLGLETDDLICFKFAKSEFGQHNDYYYKSDKVLDILNKLIDNIDYLQKENLINSQEEIQNIQDCKTFLEKAVNEDNLVQFFYT